MAKKAGVRAPNTFLPIVHHPGTKPFPFIEPGTLLGRARFKVMSSEIIAKASLKDIASGRMRERLVAASEKAAKLALQEARKRLRPQNKTGNLSRKLKYVMTGKFGFRLSAPGVKYARWLEEGTRPHIIRPVRARLLAFYWAKRAGTGRSRSRSGRAG